jgi:diguanylate cyclase (GGDEF)-like protein
LLTPPKPPPQPAKPQLAEGDLRTLAHSTRREARRRTVPQREPPVQECLDAADRRDALAATRDLAALARDRAADARDLASDEPDAAGKRALAATERQAAADDRAHAARDRLAARTDRRALAHQLALAETDPVTGARARAAGLADLDRELARCHRTRHRLVVAYVDVVGLKAINDSEGHGAGDELLKTVAGLLQADVRPYDLVIRLGGDEFLCAMSDMTLRGARQRFGTVATALATAIFPRAITVGFAELTPDDTTTEFIARADRDLLDSRAPGTTSNLDPTTTECTEPAASTRGARADRVADYNR